MIYMKKIIAIQDKIINLIIKNLINKTNFNLKLEFNNLIYIYSKKMCQIISKQRFLSLLSQEILEKICSSKTYYPDSFSLLNFMIENGFQFSKNCIQNIYDHKFVIYEFNKDNILYQIRYFLDNKINPETKWFQNLMRYSLDNSNKIYANSILDLFREYGYVCSIDDVLFCLKYNYEIPEIKSYDIFDLDPIKKKIS